MSSAADLSRRREIVALAPPATSSASIDALVARVLADASSFSNVVVPPPFAKRCVDALRGSGVAVTSVVAYPLGLSKPTIKAIEATSLAKDGVDAIEVTPYPSYLIDGDTDALRAELLEIVRGARAARPTLSIFVRVDLALPGFDEARIPSLATSILRSACDATIVDSSSPTRSVSHSYGGERVSVRR